MSDARLYFVSAYVRLIIYKKRTFDSLPDDMKDLVRERLLEEGYDTNGDPIKED